jgi:BirA family transcriptional regulator, biotin operon repressor / biotin---[acetyl-CoA-carboxylase] ligase
MKLLKLNNPFGAPIYHEETVSSTFDLARILAGQNEPRGTVISADFQEAGRGRLNRPWVTERGKSLMFTIILRYADTSSMPVALTLRTGLAVSLAVEDLAPALVGGSVQIKWPNDVMINARKAAGILTEADGKNVYIGVGVNVAQEEFPEQYRSKAESIIHSFPALAENARFDLLEKILSRLYAEIEKQTAESEAWRERLLRRLYKKGETVTFAEGAADSENMVEGILSGLGPGGELLIIPRGEEKERSFITGELRVY